MSDRLYFPRLQRDTARALLADYNHLGVPQLTLHAAVEHPQSFFYPTAPSGRQATTDVIASFQTTVRDIASKHGYPEQLPERDPARTRFDREVVGIIQQVAPMLPAEAAQEGVWSFLSLIVLPDVAFWRWPNKSRRDDYERILGYPRNVFRRLWWRAYVFGTEAGCAGAEIFEDEAVAILERTAIGGNRPLARAIAETHVGRFRGSPKRTEIMRDAMKRIRRLHAFLSFHSLDESELREVVSEVFDQAEKRGD
jgi:hypothetical protein